MGEWGKLFCLMAISKQFALF